VTLDLPEIVVRVNTPAVSKMTIESIITSAAGDVVDTAAVIDVTVASDSKAAQTIQAAVSASLEAPTKVVVAQPGDVMRFDSPHLLGLKEGPHVQTITLRIPIPGRLQPLQSRTYRLMDVKADGIHWLSMREYDDLVAVKVLAPNSDGTMGWARPGRVGPADAAPEGSVEFEAIRVADGPEAKGSAMAVEALEDAQ
jgi:hypothetical protein